MATLDFLRTEGDQIIKADGEPIILRGFGLGGWLNMENFITGFPANEEALREALLAALGREKYEYLFERFLECFFTENDARFVKSLGLNTIRIPINYRHLEDDMNPFVIKESGFRHLDRAIALCAAEGLYTIIDLHALPGYQNQGWHCDNPTNKPLFWRHKHFQDRTVRLWEAIAGRYKDNPWVAGYDLINEPYDPGGHMIMPFYRRLVDAIHSIDPHHLIFLEGNCYSRDLSIFGDPWPGIVYSNHDYVEPGINDAGPYPGYTRGEYYDREVLNETFLERSRYMLENDLHIFVGEFGPIYTGNLETDAMRYQILRDQLSIYAHHRASWSIWLYKDIGLQALVCVAPDSPWRLRIKDFLAKKARLGADHWGTTEAGISHFMDPLLRTLEEDFAGHEFAPFGTAWYARLLVRHILLSQALLPEFAELFADLTEGEIDELMDSFLFENCSVRHELADVLAAHAV